MSVEDPEGHMNKKLVAAFCHYNDQLLARDHDTPVKSLVSVTK